MTELARRIDRLLGPHDVRRRATTLRDAWLVLGVFAVVSWLNQDLLNAWLSGAPTVNQYVVKPILWLVLVGVARWGWLRLDEKPSFSGALTLSAGLGGVFHVSALVIGGMVFGFVAVVGGSPLVDYPRTAWSLATMLIGLETCRAYLFHAWAPHGIRLARAVVSGLLFFAYVPVAQFGRLNSIEGLLEAGGQSLVPILALSFLATWLAEHGGPAPPAAYLAMVVSYEGFVPLQPDPGWAVLLVLGVAIPLAARALIRSIYAGTEEGAARYTAETTHDEQDVHLDPTRPRLAWWMAAAALAGTTVLLWTGALGVRLYLVDGISMEPAIEAGDVAVVRAGVGASDLAVGDVVSFEQNGLVQLHRIVAIQDTQDGRLVTTQGDNNAAADPSIRADAVEGRVVTVIPEVGRVGLWIRRLIP